MSFQGMVVHSFLSILYRFRRMRKPPCRHCTHVGRPAGVTAWEICRVALVLVSEQRVHLLLGNWCLREAHSAFILIAMESMAAGMKKIEGIALSTLTLKDSLEPRSSEVNPIPFREVQPDSQGLLPAPIEHSYIHHCKSSHT